MGNESNSSNSKSNLDHIGKQNEASLLPPKRKSIDTLVIKI